MTLRLTPEILAGAYDFLRTTPPFRRLGLPESDDVVFKVGMESHRFGFYQWCDYQHTITISAKCVGHLYTLLITMAHEMIHLYLEHTSQESYSSAHSAAFRRMACRVCRTLGFDPKAFN